MSSIRNHFGIAAAAVALGTGGWGLGFVMGRGRDRVGSTESTGKLASAVIPVRDLSSSAFQIGDDPRTDFEPAEVLSRVMGESNAMRRSELLAAVVSRFRVSEIRAALGGLKNLPERDKYEATRVLFARWAELNPEEAAAAALQQADHSIAVEGALSAWVVRDRDAAIKWVAAIPRGSKHDSSSARLITVLSRVDPEKAYHVIQENPSLQDTNMHEIQHVMSAWTMKDPTTAAAAAVEVRDSRVRLRAVTSVASGWATNDPTAALMWARDLADLEARGTALQGVFCTWAGHDSGAAFQHAELLHLAEERGVALEAAVMGAAANDPAAGVELLERITPGPNRDQAASYVATRLTESDPRTAVRIAGEIVADDWRRKALHSALLALAQQAPAEAIDLIESLPEEKRYYLTHRQVWERWLHDDPGAAFLHVAKPGSGGKEWGNVHQAARDWASSSPDRAFAALESTAGGKPNPELLTGAIHALSRVDHLRAANIVSSNQHGKLPPLCYTAVGAQWAVKEPAAAVAWMGSLPDQSAREAAIAGIAAGWVVSNTSEAARWVQQLPAGSMRDQGILGFARETVGKDGNAALEWIATIANPETRAAGQREVLQQWQNFDRKAADAWVAANTPVASSGR